MLAAGEPFLAQPPQCLKALSGVTGPAATVYVGSCFGLPVLPSHLVRPGVAGTSGIFSVTVR